MKVFSLYDVKREMFLPVMCEETRGTALRHLSDIVAQGNNPVARYPEDFKLYELGSMDEKSGELKSLVPAVFVLEAKDVRDQLQANKENA